MYNAPKSKLLSTREAAGVLGYSFDYVSKMCRNGYLKAKREGNSWLIAPEDLEAFKRVHASKIESYRTMAGKRAKEAARPKTRFLSTACSGVFATALVIALLIGGTAAYGKADFDLPHAEASAPHAQGAASAYEAGRAILMAGHAIVNSMLEATGNTLAVLFGPIFSPNIAYAPAESSPSPASVTTVIESHPTTSYVSNFITNPVTYVYSGTGGATIEYVQAAIDRVRRDVGRRDSGNSSSGGLADLSGSSIEDLADVAAMTKSFGDVLLWDGSTWTNVATSSLGIGAGSGSPGGASGQVQYNSGGLFAGDAGFTYSAAAERVTASYASTTALSSAYASSTNAFAANLTIGSLAGILKATAGAVSIAAGGVDYENPLSFGYPLVRTLNAVSLAFGTTTANNWSAQNTFAGLFAANASSTNATTTSLGINNETFTDLTGAGLQNTGGALTLNATGDWTGTFDGQQGTFYLDRANHTGTQTASTISDFTSAVQAFIHASTTIPKTYTANTFTAGNVFSGGVTIGSLNGPLQANAGLVSATTSIGVLYGGTGLTGAPSYGQVLVGNSSGGYTLTATSSLGISGGSGVSAIGPAGQTQTGSTITLATSSTAFNGLTASTTITASGDTITFANTLAGVLGVGGGGTGSSTPLGGILTGNGTGAITSATVSAPLTFSGNTLAISQATTGTNGYLASTDFNTFNNKISSTSLSGASVVSYNSGTGVITTTGGTFGAGSYLFPGSVTAPYASSTALSSAYASSTNAFFGSLNVGTLTGLLKGVAGAVTTAVAGTDYIAGGAGAATTTVSCSGGTSCSGFTVFGSSPVTISSTAGLSSYDAWTHPLSGWSATTSIMRMAGLYSSASSTIGDGTQAGGLTVSGGATTSANAYFGGKVGIGVQAPSSLLSVNYGFGGTQPIDVTQSGTSIFTIDNAGRPTFAPTAATAGGSLYTFGNATGQVFSGGIAFMLNPQTVDSSSFLFGGLVNNSIKFLISGTGATAIGTSSPWGYFAVNPSALGSGVPEFVIGSSSATHVIVDGAGNLGVGTTSPSAKLSVQGSGLFSGSLVAQNLTLSNTLFLSGYGDGLLKNTGGTVGIATAGTDYLAAYDAWTHPAAGQSATTSLMLFNGAASSTQLSATQAYFGGTATSTFTSAGYLGIGTSTPQWMLTVASSSGPQLTLTDGSAAPFNFRSVSGNLFISTSSPTTFATSTLPALAIMSSGNVGLGTSSPAYRLHILVATGTTAFPTDVAALEVTGTNAGVGTGPSLLFKDAAVGADKFMARIASVYETAISASSNGKGGALAFYTNGGVGSLDTDTMTERLRIANTGYVGIGTTSPYALLSVLAASSTGQTFTAPRTMLFAIASSTSSFATTTLFSIDNAGSITTALGSGLVKSTAGLLSLASAGTDYVAGGAGAATTTVSCSGGTSCSGFTVFGSSPITISSSAGLSSYDAWLHQSTFGATASATTSPLWAQSGLYASSTVAFGTAGKGLQFNASNGFLGIGTTTPWGLLSVNPNALGSGVPEFVVGSSTATHLVVNGAGQVGIGTSTPSALLDISGSSAVTYTGSALLAVSRARIINLDTTNNNGSALNFTTTDANGTLSSGAAITGIFTSHTASAVSGDLAIQTRNAGTIAEVARFTAAGNVGIGTTTPQGKLVVNVGTDQNLEVLTNLNLSDGFRLQSHDNNRAVLKGFELRGSAVRLTDSTSFLQLTGGNVGIATTTPLSLLSIYGGSSAGAINVGVWDSLRNGITLNGQSAASATGYNILSGSGDTNLYLNRPSGVAIKFREANSSTDQFTLLTGGSAILPDGNLSVCTGGACPSGSPAGNGNLIAETAIGVGSSTPWAGLSIVSGKAIVVAENTLATTTSMTIDWKAGNQQLVRLGTSATTISFSGYIEGQKLVLTVCNPNATAGAISWGTQVLWGGGTAPTQTTTANKCDVWSFLATNATTTLKIFGSQTANF